MSLSLPYGKRHLSRQRLLPAALCVEKKKCIYLHDEVTDEQIIGNVLSNPVKALTKSGLFFFNEEAQVFSISPEIWASIERKSKMAITKICNQKLQDYYSK